jgi:hypothetical protein
MIVIFNIFNVNLILEFIKMFERIQFDIFQAIFF